MPLEQRVIKPICVSRSTLPLDSHDNPISIPNELECVTNGTLANVIRELSSLARYADDLFGGLVNKATGIFNRSNSLKLRVDRLSLRVTQLDSNVEEVSLQDIHLRKPFKSCTAYDQKVVGRSTMPESIKELYNACDKPPPLDKLNEYRDDGKDGLKFYTDPNYFFELWREKMLRETEKEKGIKKNVHRGPNKGPTGPGQGDKVRQRKPRQPMNTREKHRALAAQQEFIDGNVCKPGSNGTVYMNANGSVVYGHHYIATMNTTMNRPSSLELNQFMVENYQTGSTQYQPLVSNQHPTSYYISGAQTNSHYNIGNAQMSQISSHGMNSNNHSIIHNQVMSYHYANQDPSQVQANLTNQSTSARRTGSILTNRPCQPPPAPPSNPPSSSSSSGGTPNAGTPSRSRGPSLTRDSLPPPPPPPPPPPMTSGILINGNNQKESFQTDCILLQTNTQHLSSTNYIPGEKSNSIQAPPPPPPPPPMPSETKPSDTVDNKNGIIQQLPNLAQEIKAKQQQLRPSNLSTMSKILPQNVIQQHSDGRSDLLAAIREGIKLRRVEDSKQKDIEKSTPLCDVASILARRKAMELSDSESAENSDGTESDGDWDDESEC